MILGSIKEGKLKSKRCPRPEGTGHIYRSLVQLENFLGDGQAKARMSLGAFSAF